MTSTTVTVLHLPNNDIDLMFFQRTNRIVDMEHIRTGGIIAIARESLKVLLATGIFACFSPLLAQSVGNSDERNHLSGRIIRIVPIGDSVTQGGRVDRQEYTYRYPLYFMLRDAGYAVDFIGSRTSGLQPGAVWPDKDGVPFDLDHEGYYGATSAEVRDELKTVIANYKEAPDIALVQLGSNDVDAYDFEKTAIAPIIDIIAMLRDRNPNVIIFVGHLLENGRLARATRRLYERLARRSSTSASPVITVYLFDQWKERPGPGSDTFDWAHPNPQGQQKMADKWYAAMKPYLDRLNQN